MSTDVLLLAAILAFFAAFAVLGGIYLVKKKRERIEQLTAELEKPLLEAPEEAPVPTTADAAATAPPTARAEDLLAAEREAIRARADEDAARRARERAEQEATTAADDAARAKLDAARRAEADAAAKAAETQAKAKQLRLALTATRDGFVGRIAKAVGAKKDLDQAILDDIEGVLFTADIGAKTATKLLDAVKKKLSGADLRSPARVVGVLREEVKAILAKAPPKPLAVDGDKPRVMLILGVNGAGKTTTIGKLARQLKDEGRSVLLGAGDTFRAAAGEQLEIWAERAGCPIVLGKDGADPSSVLFDAVKKAKDEGLDVVLCDTAGRLHTKVNLMEELKKVVRTIGKAHEGAPHEVLLVLDATVGQNAIQQAKTFGEAAPLTGIILTKLDGTAKGGVIIGIVDELAVPVRYIGVGEKIGDLRPFSPTEFAAALFADEAEADRNAA
jgi:fused signal recognition particle receptor